ncbi:MAG: response regulator [Candidatus Omnitrophica bacterium]|nr:response regulator [Candidatus Omnitrophota bacterium]
MAKRILVIDDEALVTESLKKLLKKSGYDAEVAKNGAEAMQKIEKSDFDLIVSDIRMPDINGIEIIKRIRQHLQQNKKKAVPEILITGYASKEHMDEAKALNVADYIYKPFNIRDFLDIIRKNLSS